MNNYVWYASYGSNISTERFLCYIKGGQAKGAMTSEVGCRDQSLPKAMENIKIYRQQYFAKASKRWQNKGVAFIGETSTKPTLGRMYLIKKDQFVDVVKQENGIHPNDALFIDFDYVQEKGTMKLLDSWYGTLLYLGDHQNYPIYTFTNNKGDDNRRPPSSAYLQMIGSGIIEHYDMNLQALTDYFSEKPGVQNTYDEQTLKGILGELYE